MTVATTVHFARPGKPTACGKSASQAVTLSTTSTAAAVTCKQCSRRAASGLIGSANGSALTRPPSHGGYREGSGRKPILDGGIKRTFVLTRAHLAMIDAWGDAHGTDNRSASLRHLIETASKGTPTT